MSVAAATLVVATARSQVADYVSTLISVYVILILLYIVSTLFFSFGGRAPYNRALNAVLEFLRQVCEPYLRFFRRFIPPLGPLDLSPMVGIIVLYVVGGIVVGLIPRVGMARGRVLGLAALTALVVVAVDQLVKVLVRDGITEGEQRDLLGAAVRLVHIENDGVAFGRLSGSPALVALVVGGALVALLVYFATHLEVPGIWLPTGMLLGGAIGNVVDRATRGAVTDYVKLPHWPAFNIADAAITLGVVVLLVVVERDARRRDRAAQAATAAERGDGAPGPA